MIIFSAYPRLIMDPEWDRPLNERALSLVPARPRDTETDIVRRQAPLVLANVLL